MLINTILDHEYAIDVTEEEEEQHSSPFPFADPETLAKLKDLEKQAVIAAEAKEFTAAIEILSTIINESPFYASAYNNRAQVYRMQGGMEKALEDLEMAILYGTGNGSILKQAYTHCAVIKKKLGDDLGAEEDFAKGAQLGNGAYSRSYCILNYPPNLLSE